MKPVVILGCRLTDGRPGAALVRRLEAGLPLARRAEKIVVTGAGEAPAMASWLVDKGIDPSNILIDNEATSTNENLENAQRLLRDDTCWDVVTSDFHAPRVKMWAAHQGLDIDVTTAVTPRARRAYLWGREVLAMVHSAARVAWRRLVRLVPRG